MSKGVHKGVHDGVHEQSQLSKSITLWSPQKAADECGISRSTIMRKLYADEIPGAEKVGTSWAIPVPGLIAAGLKPGVPSPPEDKEKSKPVQGVHEGVHEGVQGVHMNTLKLQHQLELAELRERSLRQELAAQKSLAEERAARIEDLQTALRMLGPGESDRKSSANEDSTPAPEEPAEEKKEPAQETPLNTAEITGEKPAPAPVPEPKPTVAEEQPRGFMARMRQLFS